MLSDLLPEEAVLGVTATRNKITQAQKDWLTEQLRKARALHHGACVGGDETAHDLAVLFGLSVYVHPPVDEKLMMPRAKFKGMRIIVYDPLPYLARNRVIVHECRKLLVLPDGPERLHSGTWSTCRYAAHLKRSGEVCYPNGDVLPIRKAVGCTK